MGISVSVKEDKQKTEKWIKEIEGINYKQFLKKYGDKGVKALSDATPKDTGKTASSWRYEIVKEGRNKYRLVFINDNVVNDWANVAILIQYGHATKSGGWVEGIDYINPALDPIFNELSKEIDKELKK